MPPQILPDINFSDTFGSLEDRLTFELWREVTGVECGIKPRLPNVVCKRDSIFQTISIALRIAFL